MKSCIVCSAKLEPKYRTVGEIRYGGKNIPVIDCYVCSKCGLKYDKTIVEKTKDNKLGEDSHSLI